MQHEHENLQRALRHLGVELEPAELPAFSSLLHEVGDLDKDRATFDGSHRNPERQRARAMRIANDVDARFGLMGRCALVSAAHLDTYLALVEEERLGVFAEN